MRDYFSLMIFVLLWIGFSHQTWAEKSWETENDDSISDLEELSKLLWSEQLFQEDNPNPETANPPVKDDDVEKTESTAVSDEEAKKTESTAVTDEEAKKTESTAVTEDEAKKTESTSVTKDEAKKTESTAVTKDETEKTESTSVTKDKPQKTESTTVTKVDPGKTESTTAIVKNVCEDGTHKCDIKTTKCVSSDDGGDYYCKCLENYLLKDVTKDAKKNKESCIKKTPCNDGTDTCPEDSTVCKMKKDSENEYYCDCLKGFKIKTDGGKKEDNKEACIISCSPNICKNKGKCNAKEHQCECLRPYMGTLCEQNLWCENNKYCTDRADCNYKDDIGVGYCKCKARNETFNYAENKKKCEVKPSCVEIKCAKFEKCSNGECECVEGYSKKENSTKCVSELCENNGGCFEGSNCTDTNILGVKKCTCVSGKYYSTNQCKDAKCLLSKSSCEECPNGMVKDNGKCRQKDGDDKFIPCDKNCGNYGWCFKGGEDEPTTCKCSEEIAEFDEKGKTCVLKQTVCPQGVQLTEDKMKCNCNGKFKLAKNGITCERRTCSDEDVQNECKEQNALCSDNWNKESGFTCDCPQGYERNELSSKCVDPCNIYKNIVKCNKLNKACFLDDEGKFECRCPLGLESQSDGSCKVLGQDLEKNTTYIINALPVLSVKYKKSFGIDVIELSKDIVASMMATFSNLLFARLYTYKLNNDVIDCSVWLQFKKDAEFDYKRLKVQTLALENSSADFLAPSLLLKSNTVKDVKENERKSFCSELDDDPFCEGVTCAGDKCDCKKGYEIIKTSLKIYDGGKFIFKCKDINECKIGKHECNSGNSECLNTDGSYFCRCKPGFKTEGAIAEINNKKSCIAACENPNPCQNDGICKLNKEKTAVECTCKIGYSGSFCDTQDLRLASAQQKTVVVGAVLGSILGLLVIGAAIYAIRKKQKDSYSEDFSPAPPQLQNAEMMERRPMRGVSNRAYQ